MSEDVSDILRTAITMARNEQIRSVEELRKRLGQEFPNQENQIDEAISC